MANGINFSGADWARIERDWSAWWAGELDRPLLTYEYEPVIGHPGYDEEFSLDFMLHRPAEEVITFYTDVLERTSFFWDTFPRWRPTFGVANAWFLGAEGRFFPESHSIAFTPPHPVPPIEALSFRYDAENVYLQRALELMRAALRRWGSQVSVGIYDIFSNLDLLDIFRGTQQLALDMVDAPGEVLRLMREAIEVNRCFYADAQAARAGIARGCSTWGPLWAPGSYTMVQSDYSYMISPRMFERFVLPDVAAWAEQTEYTCYHLDGPGQLAHLDKLLALEKLNAIQWQPGAGQPTAAAWPQVLKKIRDAGKLCQVYAPMTDALQITRELGGRGFVFTVLDYVSPTEARDFERALRAAGRAA